MKESQLSSSAEADSRPTSSFSSTVGLKSDVSRDDVRSPGFLTETKKNGMLAKVPFDRISRWVIVIKQCRS